MIDLERHDWFIETEQNADNIDSSSKELYLKQGRIKARYYAWMRLATATIEYEEAKKHLNDVMANWENL